MKSSNIKPKSCPMCDKYTVVATYEERARYRYYCKNCGQYFEFNAPSQFAADIIFNEVIRGRIDYPTEKVEADMRGGIRCRDTVKVRQSPKTKTIRKPFIPEIIQLTFSDLENDL